MPLCPGDVTPACRRGELACEPQAPDTKKTTERCTDEFRFISLTHLNGNIQIFHTELDFFSLQRQRWIAGPLFCVEAQPFYHIV